MPSAPPKPEQQAFSKRKRKVQSVWGGEEETDVGEAVGVESCHAKWKRSSVTLDYDGTTLNNHTTKPLTPGASLSGSPALESNRPPAGPCCASALGAKESKSLAVPAREQFSKNYVNCAGLLMALQSCKTKIKKRRLGRDVQSSQVAGDLGRQKWPTEMENQFEEV